MIWRKTLGGPTAEPSYERFAAPLPNRQFCVYCGLCVTGYRNGDSKQFCSELPGFVIQGSGVDQPNATTEQW